MWLKRSLYTVYRLPIVYALLHATLLTKLRSVFHALYRSSLVREMAELHP